MVQREPSSAPVRLPGRFPHIDGGRGEPVMGHSRVRGDSPHPRAWKERIMLQRKRWAAASASATALATALVIAGGPALAAAGWTVVSVPPTGNNTELNGAS